MTPPSGARRRATTTLLREAIDAQQSDDITIDTLLVPLRARAFGVVLLVLAIPNFIPAPIGIGGVMGVLIVMLGLELLCGLEHPLVPGWLRRKSIHRTRAEHFLRRSDKVMRWLERWCNPRFVIVTQRPWSMLSGVALVILGLLLSLPIPFTNYPFGVVMLAFAFALIERDGALLVVLWLLAAALLVLAFIFSDELVYIIEQVFQQLLQWF